MVVCNKAVLLLVLSPVHCINVSVFLTGSILKWPQAVSEDVEGCKVDPVPWSA